MYMPLSFSPLAVTSTVEATEDLFREQFTDSKILQAESNSSFGVWMNAVQLGGITLSCLHHLSDYDVDSKDIERDDSILFGYGSGPPSSTAFRGVNFNLNEHGFIIAKNSSVTHRRRTNSLEFVVDCQREPLERKLNALLNRHTSRKLTFDQTFRLGSGLGCHARSSISHIFESLDSNPDLLHNPIAIANFEELLLGSILTLPNNYSNELISEQPASVLPTLVRRAEAFIEENAHLPLTTSEILLAVGCGRNTLFKNFKKFRGYTPWEFLTTTRLRLARNQLLKASSQDSVTSIAYSLGFSHMGRFSLIYAKRYGEKPSEARARAKT